MSAAALAAIVLPDDGRSPVTVVVAGIGYLVVAVLYYRAASRHPEENRVGVTLIRTSDTAHSPAADGITARSSAADGMTANSPAADGIAAHSPAADGIAANDTA